MLTKHTFAFSLIAALCLFAALVPTHAQDQDGFQPSDCPFANATAIQIDCGWLIVPENHADPTGNTIRLAVAIIRATGAQRQPDPIIYLAGGPGSGVVGAAPSLAVRMAQTTRDIVLIDQRGMGLSEPGLYCPNISEWMLLSGASIEDEIRNCRTALDAAGVHSEFYTTEQNAADIADARRLLGYESVNLFGISYGTRLALTVVRDFPEGIRSVTLDSTHPPQIMYNETGDDQSDFERSFGILESLCEADIACRAAYPNLRETYIQTFEKLNQQPLSVEVNNQSIAVNGSLFETLVYTSLYRPNTLAGLPALIYSTADGDDTLLRHMLEPITEDSDHTRSLGTVLSILCPDNAALNDGADNGVHPAFANPFPAMNGEQSARNCRAWGVDKAQHPASAINDSIPVLIVAGEFDPVTNPAWGELATKTLAKAFYVRFPNLGHGITDNPCGGMVFAQFLDNPMRPPDTSCRSEIAAPAFVLDAGRTYPGVVALSILFSVIGVWGVFSAGRAFIQQPYGFAWGAAVRKMGWIPAAISTGGVLLTNLGVAIPFLPSDRTLIVQTLVPLMAGIQAAMIFAPDDEPALEIQLAAPRPVLWLVGERLAIVWLIQGGIGLAGTLLSLHAAPDQNLLVVLSRWLVPMLFLSGVGLYVIARTRVPLFGMLVAGLLWFGFSIFGDFFVPGQPFGAPINLIQPFMWSIHLYLEPDALSQTYYWLNRFSVTSGGLALLVLAGNKLRKREQILMGGRRESRKAPRTTVTVQPTSQNPVTWVSYAVEIIPWRQFMGIVWYEYRLAWRKRAVLVIAVTLFAAVLVGALLIEPMLSGAMIVNPSGLSPEQTRHMTTLGAIMSTWPLLSIIFSFIAPLVSADSITYDRQTGMSELFGGMPVADSIYLVGKTAGVTLLLLTSLVGAMLFSIIIWGLKTGGIDWLPFLDMWIVGGGLTLLLNIPLAILLGSTQPNRLRALGIVLAAFAIPVILSTFVGGAADYLSLTRPSIATFYMNLFPEGVLNPSNLTVPSALMTGAIQITVLTGCIEIFGGLLIAQFAMNKRRLNR